VLRIITAMLTSAPSPGGVMGALETAPRFLVGSGRAQSSVKDGARGRRSSWNAGIRSNMPASKEDSCAAATSAITLRRPNDCLCRLPITNPRNDRPAPRRVILQIKEAGMNVSVGSAFASTRTSLISGIRGRTSNSQPAGVFILTQS